MRRFFSVAAMLCFLALPTRSFGGSLAVMNILQAAVASENSEFQKHRLFIPPGSNLMIGENLITDYSALIGKLARPFPEVLKWNDRDQYDVVFPVTDGRNRWDVLCDLIVEQIDGPKNRAYLESCDLGKFECLSDDRVWCKEIEEAIDAVFQGPEWRRLEPNKSKSRTYGEIEFTADKDDPAKHPLVLLR